jgi:hypothetical protein
MNRVKKKRRKNEENSVKERGLTVRASRMRIGALAAAMVMWIGEI